MKETFEVEQPSLFDYATLDISTRSFVRVKAESIHARLKRTAEDIILIGLDLLEVKARLHHGQFGKWLQSEFSMTERHAQNFMNVGTRFGSKSEIIADLPVTVIYELAAPSTPQRVIEMIEEGVLEPTVVNIREVKQEIRLIEQEQKTSNAHLFSPPQPRVMEDPPITSFHRGVPAALQMSESVEWYTPSPYVNASRELMGGIDVDPASNAYANAKVVHATTYYDMLTNGLDKPWNGRIWLNPPYGRDGGDSNQEIWSRRLIEQYERGITTEAVLLVNAVTDRKWFHPLWRFLICFTDHRIKFYNRETESTQPTHGNALVYLGKQEERFYELFSQFGVVIKQYRRGE